MADDYVIRIDHCEEDDENFFLRIPAENLDDAVLSGFATYAAEVLDRAEGLEYTVDEIKGYLTLPMPNEYGAYVFSNSIVLPDEGEDVPWALVYPYTPPTGKIWMRAERIEPNSELDSVTETFSGLTKKCTLLEGPLDLLEEALSFVKK